MTNQKQYRLLNEGEQVQNGDEWFDTNRYPREVGWHHCATYDYPIGPDHTPHRRLIVPAPTWPEARPISQAPYHQRILVWGDGIGWAVFQTGAGPVNEQVYQWWLPMPPAPEPLRDWERAWQWWLENNRRADTDKESFFGGWNNALNWAQKQAAQKGDVK